MRVFSLILPAFVVLVLFVATHNYDLWWAYLLMLGGAEGLVFLFHYIFKHNTAKEYVSGFVVCVEHYNEWVERVEKTKTEYDSKGNAHTITYYEYVTHPEYWQECYNTGHTKRIPEAYFYQMCQLFGTGLDYFQTYHRNCVSGGGGQRCEWNGREWDTTTATFKQGYYNPILYSNSIFKFRHISAEEAQKYELLQYPPIIGDEQNVVCYQPSIASRYDYPAASPQDDVQVLFQHVNAFLGKAKQIHVFVLVFDAKKYGVEVAEIQRSYWQGGNKNELTICIGVDDDSVKWCEAFSWMDDPTLHVEIRDYFLQNTKFDLIKFVYWLPGHLGKWKRREAAEFKYLSTNLPRKSKIWLLVISLILSGFCVFATLQWIGIPEKKSVAPVVEELVVEQPHEEHSREAFSSQADGTDTISSVTDYDGNTYPIVRIGNQVWMAENLRTTHYADGTYIEQGFTITIDLFYHPNDDYAIAYWYYPNDNSTNKATYGLLYNWKAVMHNSYSSSSNPSGIQGICPDGWHVPSDNEWKQMEMAVGMRPSDADNTDYRGSIAIKLSDNTGWKSSQIANAAGNTSAPNRNSSGFSALPAGYYNSRYGGFGTYAYFWSATENNSSNAYGRVLNRNNAGVYRYANLKSDSYSVRCVRD